MDSSIYDNIRDTRFTVHGRFFIPNARILIFYVTPSYMYNHDAAKNTAILYLHEPGASNSYNRSSFNLLSMIFLRTIGIAIVSGTSIRGCYVFAIHEKLVE